MSKGTNGTSPAAYFTQTQPDALSKLTQMGDVTQFEPSGDRPMMERRRAPYQSHSLAECITNVSTPTGSKPILKAMLTTACERNCFYCPFRAGRSKTKRMTFSPDEMAGAFDTLQRAERVQCERYDDRGPFATEKVSHLPHKSAMLERQFKRAEEERCIQWHFEMKFVPGS
jgi:predicted HD phosphohydrolase